MSVEAETAVVAKAPASTLSRRPRARTIVLGVLTLLALYLLFYPVRIAPVAWTPTRDPGFDGAFRPTIGFGSSDRFAGRLVGPEAIAWDPAGRLHAGLLDGRIVRVGPGERVETLVQTGGRPLGMVFDPDGTLYVADVHRGLLAVAPNGAMRVLVDARAEHMAFVDDVDRLPDGRLVFTDASRFGLEDYKLDLIEHRAHGRVFEFDPRTGVLRQLARGLQFANGIAASADGTFALVCETGAYRVQRIELDGPRRGKMRVVASGLPGFCDNVRRSPAGDVFWVAIPSPRNRLLDRTARWPFLRKVVARLPRFLQPAPSTTMSFVGIRADGRVVAVGQDLSEGAYGPVTTVAEHAGSLYLGSLSATGLARMRLPVHP